MRENRTCGEMESAGEWRVQENGESSRMEIAEELSEKTESAGERREGENGEWGRTESVGESVGEHRAKGTV